VSQRKLQIKQALVGYGYMRSTQHITFVSTHGSKDYEIKNKKTGTVRPWNLLHIAPGDVQPTQPLQTDATYMICAVEGSSLDCEFKKIAGVPSSTAQIVSYGMRNVDFNFLTSNQI
jgi:hypothetical protein